MAVGSDLILHFILDLAANIGYTIMRVKVNYIILFFSLSSHSNLIKVFFSVVAKLFVINLMCSGTIPWTPSPAQHLIQQQKKSVGRKFH